MTDTSQTTETEIRELGRKWAAAEQRGDVPALDALAADDFTLVGPFGFVLTKEQWLDRYRTGALVTKVLTWDQIEVRDYGNAAVAIGCHTQQAAYQGQPADGSFRATHVAVRRDGRWLLVGIHLSPIGAPSIRPRQPDTRA
jgi:uncharacterized protein (TIGR02246 family)